MTETIASTEIHTSDAERGDVLISLSYPRVGDDDVRVVDLRVEDGVSGVTLVRVRLSAEQFTDMLSNAATRVGGAVLPPHPERIGRRMQNTHTTIRSYGGVDAEATRVREQYLADGWESVRVVRTNYGRKVVAYRWVNDDAG